VIRKIANHTQTAASLRPITPEQLAISRVFNLALNCVLKPKDAGVDFVPVFFHLLCTKEKGPLKSTHPVG
jgi:hypothetical protein